MNEALAAAARDVVVPREMGVTHVTRDTHDTFSLELDPGPGGFPFEPGQFNMLYTLGHGEVPISISGDPAHPEELRHTIRAVGSVTRALQGLRRGDSVGVRGPFGSTWPMHEARGKDLVLIAGGIGLAPLKPTIYHALHHRRAFRRVSILYGTRSPEDVLYPKELEKWARRRDVDLQITVDRAGPQWREHVGVVPALIRHAVFDPDNCLAMVCGPEVMIRFTIRELKRRHMPDRSIWISMERNMNCAVGFCGHCQLGPLFICRDGPVLRLDRVRPLLDVWEV